MAWVLEFEHARVGEVAETVDVSGGQGLRRRTVRGVGWTTTSQVLIQAMSFVTMVVLARLLTPSDFGLAGLVALFTGFVALFVNFGLSAALIQRETISEAHRSSAFWLNLSVGVGLSVVTVLLAPVLAAFFDQPRLSALLAAVAPTFTVGALAIVQSALLQRDMRFRRLAAIEIAALLSAAALAISVAAIGGGVWSLLAYTLTMTVSRSILLWLGHSWRPDES